MGKELILAAMGFLLAAYVALLEINLDALFKHIAASDSEIFWITFVAMVILWFALKHLVKKYHKVGEEKDDDDD